MNGPNIKIDEYIGKPRELSPMMDATTLNPHSNQIIQIIETSPVIIKALKIKPNFETMSVRIICDFFLVLVIIYVEYITY
jgi:hypothetical protein